MNPSSMRNMMSRKGSNKLFNSSVNTDDNMTYDFDDEPSSSNISTKSYSTNVNSDSRVETNENTKLLGSVAKETLAIKRIRVLLLLTLLVASTGIVIVTYFTAKSNESSQFNSTYESLTSKLATSITDIQYQQIGQMVSFAVAVESYGMNNRNSSGGWPFVTIPQFHEQADIVLGSSNALYVALSPLVTDKSLHLWKRYVGINNRDFSESIFYQNEGGEEIIDPGPGPYMVSDI